MSITNVYVKLMWRFSDECCVSVSVGLLVYLLWCIQTYFQLDVDGVGLVELTFKIEINGYDILKFHIVF